MSRPTANHPARAQPANPNDVEMAKALTPRPCPCPHPAAAPTLPLLPRRFSGSPDSPELAALVSEHHAAYVSALRALWDGHKDQLAPCRRRSLVFVE